MPQASQHTIDQFRKYFGTDAFDGDALDYLSSKQLNDHRGHFDYTEEQWADPKVRAALFYLAEEWDYTFCQQEPDND